MLGKTLTSRRAFGLIFCGLGILVHFALALRPRRGQQWSQIILVGHGGLLLKYPLKVGEGIVDATIINAPSSIINKGRSHDLECTKLRSATHLPRKEFSKDHGNWNHYYIRAINGEVRLWVNGQEVSGGSNCDPAQG